MTVGPDLILASASPRRSQVLSMLELPHEVVPADIAEVLRPGESPADFVERLACSKARVVSQEYPKSLVLAGDTVVVLDDDVLGKPADTDEAVAMLLRLSGREHVVASGLALASPEGGLRSTVELARVHFRVLDSDQARVYAETGEPLDKAGAYGIQGLGASLVTHVEGDYYTVVGLPISGLMDLFESSGWRYAFGHLTRR